MKKKKNSNKKVQTQYRYTKNRGATKKAEQKQEQVEQVEQVEQENKNQEEKESVNKETIKTEKEVEERTGNTTEQSKEEQEEIKVDQEEIKVDLVEQTEEEYEELESLYGVTNSQYGRTQKISRGDGCGSYGKKMRQISKRLNDDKKSKRASMNKASKASERNNKNTNETIVTEKREYNESFVHKQAQEKNQSQTEKEKEKDGVSSYEVGQEKQAVASRQPVGQNTEQKTLSKSDAVGTVDNRAFPKKVSPNKTKGVNKKAIRKVPETKAHPFIAMSIRTDGIPIAIDYKDGESRYFSKTGYELLAFMQSKNYNNFEHRRQVDGLVRYCNSNNRMIAAKVVMLTGFKNTGKTTVIMHTIEELLNNGVRPDEIKYVSIIDENATMYNICKNIASGNQKYIFIDNVTEACDFVERCNLIIEMLGDYRKIVVAGDNVWAMNTASREKLYGRALKFDMAMLFYEYSKMFNGEYSKMVNREVVAQFMSKDSLACNINFDGISNPYTFLRDIVLSGTIKEMRKDTERLSKWGRGLVTLSDYKLVYIAFMTILRVNKVLNRSTSLTGSKEIEHKVDRLMARWAPAGVAESVVSIEQNIGAYCKEMMQLLIDIDVIAPLQNVIEETEQCDGIKQETEIQYICKIPSLLYSIICETDVKNGMNMDDYVLGIMTEGLIASQCCVFTDKKEDIRVFYARYTEDEAAQRRFSDTNGTPEIDVVVQRTKKNSIGKMKKSHILIEVKSSTDGNISFAKNLNSGSIDVLLDDIQERYVVYNGETRVICGTQFINIFDFLSRMDRWLKFKD